MTYEMYRTLFLVGAIAAGVMLVVTVALFFAFNIPKIIGILSGATARKAIRQIQFQTEGYSERIGRSALGSTRGKTDTLPGASRTQKQRNGVKRTQKIETGQLQQRAQAPQGMEAAAETTVLQPETEFSCPASETSVLSPAAEPTPQGMYYGSGQEPYEVLSQEAYYAPPQPAYEAAPRETFYAPPRESGTVPAFAVEYDITFTFSDVEIP